MGKEIAIKTDDRLIEILTDAKKSIREMADIGELLKVRARAGGYEEAWKNYYRTSGLGFEQMFAGWEVKVRSERRMGGMLPFLLGNRQKGGRPTKERLHDETVLDDLGISKIQSYRYQRLFRIDEDKFDSKIEELRGSWREPTTVDY